MSRFRRALAATAGVVALGALGVNGTAYAAVPGDTVLTDCDFTVTSAGNGMQVLAKDGSTPVATLQTGQVFDLFNITRVINGVIYWNAETSPGRVLGDWYPVRSSTTTVVYMQRDPTSCSVDSQ